MRILTTMPRLFGLACLCVALGGCAFTAGAVTGAAATEVLHDEGYELDSPIQKEDDDD